MKNQRGFVLVELLVTVAITSLIGVLLGMSVQQIVSVPEKGSDEIEALHSVQNAIHWVGLDAGSAMSAVGGGSLQLTMPDDSVITYQVTGTDLYRSSGGENVILARCITDITFTVNSRIITMEITAKPEGRWDISEEQAYQVAMRPSGT